MANRKKQKKKYDYGPGCYERSLNADKGSQITAELLAVEQWKEFSMKNQREDVIRDQILSDINSVCISYICRFSRLSEEFIDELIGLSTGLFNYTNYDLEQVLLISKLCIEEPERREKIIESLLYKYYAPLVDIQRKKLEDQIQEAKINKKKTNKTVTPEPIIDLSLSPLFFWNFTSPTDNTSSKIKTSGSTIVATEKPNFATIPEE